jgi:hypothetical protein
VSYRQPKPTPTLKSTLNNALREAFNYEGSSYQLIYHFTPADDKREGDKMRRSTEGRRRSSKTPYQRTTFSLRTTHCADVTCWWFCPSTSERRGEGGSVARLVPRRDEGDDELLF